eukprot:3403155-Alexandrium_andersonii.AAC.1
MSASLVGSEMCIRDRGSCASRSRGSSSPAAVRSSPASPESPESGPCPPVSYTHLTLPTICSV